MFLQFGELWEALTTLLSIALPGFDYWRIDKPTATPAAAKPA